MAALTLVWIAVSTLTPILLFACFMAVVVKIVSSRKQALVFCACSPLMQSFPPPVYVFLPAAAFPPLRNTSQHQYQSTGSENQMHA